MDLITFKRELFNRLGKDDGLNIKDYKETLEQVSKKSKNMVIPNYLLIIVIEEITELLEEIVEFDPYLVLSEYPYISEGDDDIRYHILEECADNIICIKHLSYMFGFDDDFCSRYVEELNGDRKSIRYSILTDLGRERSIGVLLDMQKFCTKYLRKSRNTDICLSEDLLGKYYMVVDGILQNLFTDKERENAIIVKLQRLEDTVACNGFYY